MDKEFLPDLSGKCISARLLDSEYSHDLFDPKFEYQGGILFLVGTIPKGCSDSDWNAGEIGAFSWSRVINYTLFASLESYTKAIEISESYQENESK